MNEASLPCVRFALGIVYWVLGYGTSRISHAIRLGREAVITPTWLWWLCGAPLSERRVTKVGLALQIGGIVYILAEFATIILELPASYSFRVSFWAGIVAMALVFVSLRILGKRK